jgi:polyhydroxyalkanoate synthesis regulator phasin
MSIELTKEEKIQIVNNHIKNLKTNKYNLEVSLIEENALESVSDVTVSSLTTEISNTVSRIQALEAEITRLQ